MTVFYCGDQLVNVVNYMIICEHAFAIQGLPKHLANKIIGSSDEGNSIVRI